MELNSNVNDNEGIATPAVDHEPPSLPPSPDPKKARTSDGPNTAVSIASILNDREASNVTPTPIPHHTNGHAPQALSMNAAQIPLEVKFLSEKAKAPTRGSALAAGYDLYSASKTVIPARSQGLVETDIAIAVPAGTYGRVAPRSGLAAKHGIHTGAGVIDADYRGPLKVLLFNLSDADLEVQPGDRIAQLILERIFTPDVVVVQELSDTARGAGGFGSTGGFNVVVQPGAAPAAGTASGTVPAV